MAHKVKLENKSARVLHIGLGDGQTLSVPPTEGGVEFTLTDEEQKLLDKNLETPAVQALIEAGELVVGGGGDKTAPKAEDKSEGKHGRKPFFGEGKGT